MSFTLLDTPTVGLEDIQRALFYVFFESLNNALTEVSGYWTQRDQRFNELTGRDIPVTVLETIPNDNFHEGHKPSLILAGPESFPNIAVFAMRADPSAESAHFDHIDSWNDLLLVETMVKGTDEDTTNRRIQRTVEAIILCIRRNRDLGGAVNGISSAPSIMISDLFAVASSPSQGGGYGERYVWQGAQINFRVQKDSVSPSSGPGTFAQASQVDYSQYIDQG